MGGCTKVRQKGLSRKRYSPFDSYAGTTAKTQANGADERTLSASIGANNHVQVRTRRKGHVMVGHKVVADDLDDGARLVVTRNGPNNENQPIETSALSRTLWTSARPTCRRAPACATWIRGVGPHPANDEKLRLAHFFSVWRHMMSRDTWYVTSPIAARRPRR